MRKNCLFWKKSFHCENFAQPTEKCHVEVRYLKSEVLGNFEELG